MSAIKLSVVIATFNRRHILERTLPALLTQNLSPEDYEIIFVVDGSTDGTAEVLHSLKPRCALRVIEQPHRGPSAARNTGIDVARGDLVLFLDDDIICSPSLLRQHVAAHAAPDPVAVQGSIFLAPGTPASILKYANEIWYKEYYDRLTSQTGLKWPDEVHLISNSSLPRATLLACGGFDERFPAQEDYELSLRLWKMGVRFQLLPDAAAYELYVKPSRDFLRNDGETYGRAEVMLCRKYPEHRPLSRLAGLGRTVWWKSFPRQVVLRFPVLPVCLFTVPIRVCEGLWRFPAMQKAGSRLLAYGRRIVELRSAVKEAGSWKALQREFGMRLPVLLYHHVGPLRAGTFPEWTVSPERFERQVRWLARRGYTGICPSDWVRWRRDGKGLPDKPVLLTFDDGYVDLAEYALPVLRRYGFGAAVFVVTGQIGGENRWDQAHGSGPHRLMTAEQIRKWAAHGIEFGAHSRTHPDLTALSRAEVADEVAGSGQDLTNLLGTRIVSFAYSYGHNNETVRDSVRRTFDLAFTCEEGLNDLRSDPLLLRRTMVQSNDSWLDLESRVHWGWNLLERLRARLRLRTRAKALLRRLFERRE